MAYLKLNQRIAENVNGDHLIKLLNDIIDAETAKPLDSMDCDLIDACVDALLEIEKDENHTAALVPLMQDEKFLRLMKHKTGTWSSLNVAARTAIIAAAIMGSTITANAMVDSIFDYNILEHIGAAIGLAPKDDKSEVTQKLVLDEKETETTADTEEKTAAVTQESTTAKTVQKTTSISQPVSEPSAAEPTGKREEKTTEKPGGTTKQPEKTTKKPTATTKQPEKTTKRVDGEDVYDKTTQAEDVTHTVKVVGLDAILSEEFKLHYIYGETLSYQGLTLEAKMSDGTTKPVALSDCVYTDQVNMSKTADVTLSILYQGFLVEIDITVRPSEETRISEIKSNARYEYLLCASGAYVTAYKGNDSELCCDYVDGAGSARIFAVSNSVFQKNTVLRSVDLPFVTELGNSVFEGCSSLIGVAAPQIQTIGARVFYDCSALAAVDLGSDLETIGDQTFAKTALRELTLGEKVTKIPASLCEDCTELEKVTMLGQVTEIGDWAFAECEALTSVAGTENLKTVGAYAFSNCENVQFAFPKQLISAGENAFYFCRRLEIGDIPQTLTDIGPRAFAYCSGITSITVPKGIDVIAEDAFKATNATKLVLPEGVVRLEDGAFESCKFTTVKLPSTVRYIGEHALYTVLLNEVDFSPYAIVIDDKAFYLSKRLTFACYQGTVPYQYALENQIKYKLKWNLPEISEGEDD